jgi:transposase
MDSGPPRETRHGQNELRIALGRKNYLFFGNNDAARNFAVLYSLVVTAERHGINPLDYLADVLMRVQTHPAKRIDELLPHRWKSAAPTA